MAGVIGEGNGPADDSGCLGGWWSLLVLGLGNTHTGATLHVRWIERRRGIDKLALVVVIGVNAAISCDDANIVAATHDGRSGRGVMLGKSHRRIDMAVGKVK